MINGYDTLQGDKYRTALSVNQRQLKTKTKQAFNGIYRRYFFSHQVPSTTYKQVKAGYDLHFSLV